MRIVHRKNSKSGATTTEIVVTLLDSVTRSARECNSVLDLLIYDTAI